MNDQSSARGPQGSLLGKRLQLQIEKLAVGGYGVSRHEGFVLFVPFSAPGDLVLAEVVEEKASHGFAEIREVLTASPERTIPACPYYYECGGCNWQHLSHDAQLKHKESLVRESLNKFLKKEIEVQPVIASPAFWRYRNRVQLATDGKVLGFRKRKSHDIIDIEDCSITEEALLKALPEIRGNLKPGTQRIELFLNSQYKPVWENFTSSEDSVGFSQVNRFQNETIINTLKEWVRPQRQNILELYAGSGNFTWPLAKGNPAGRVTAVELNPLLVERALQHRKEFPSVHFFGSDVESFLQRWNLTQHDLIILDPPRQGASEYIMKSLAWAQAEQIIYLSCHPVSLARDLAWFLSANQKAPRRYQIHRVQPFEMFPQTDHVETLVELRAYGVD